MIFGKHLMNNNKYYAVIFTSQLNDIDLSEYNETAKKMVELAKTQKGFLGMESFRDEDRNGITISYCKVEHEYEMNHV